MPILSTAKQTLERVEALLGTLSSPRDQMMLTQWRDHWLGEVTGDLDAALAVLPEDCFLLIRGSIPADAPFEKRGHAAMRGAYQSMIDVNLKPAGAYHDELFAFADWGMIMEAVWSNVMYGAMIQHLGDFDDEALYLVDAPVTMVCPFSEGRMQGKRDIIAPPISIEPTDRATLERLVAL